MSSTFPTRLRDAALQSQLLWSEFPEIEACDLELDLREIEAMVRVFSALEPDLGLSLLEKIRVYDGEPVFRKGMGIYHDAYELRRRAGGREGRDGISASATATILSTLARHRQSERFIPVADFIEALKKYVETGTTSYLQNNRARLLAFISGDLATWYFSRSARRAAQAKIANFSQKCQALFEQYVHGVIRTQSSHPSEPSSSRLSQVLQDIEGEMPVRCVSRFRSSVLTACMIYSTQNRTPYAPYTMHKDLAELIESVVVERG